MAPLPTAATSCFALAAELARRSTAVLRNELLSEGQTSSNAGTEASDLAAASAATASRCSSALAEAASALNRSTREDFSSRRARTADSESAAGGSPAEGRPENPAGERP